MSDPACVTQGEAGERTGAKHFDHPDFESEDGNGRCKSQKNGGHIGTGQIRQIDLCAKAAPFDDTAKQSVKSKPDGQIENDADNSRRNG